MQSADSPSVHPEAPAQQSFDQGYALVFGAVENNLARLKAMWGLSINARLLESIAALGTDWLM